METYHRNIVYRVDTERSTARPVASFASLLDALAFADTLEPASYESIKIRDLENLFEGDMTSIARKMAVAA